MHAMNLDVELGGLTIQFSDHIQVPVFIATWGPVY